MTRLRALSDNVAVSPQLWPEEISALAEGGVALLVNNRPDGEDPGQPTADSIAAAAHAAGLGYRHIPVRGMPSPADVEAFESAMNDAADGRIVAFCRSGMRSSVMWALAEAARGGDPDAIRQAAFEAGYDLSNLPL